MWKLRLCLISLMFLSACSKEQQYVQPPIQQQPVQVAQPQPQQVYQQPAPVVVQQAPENHDMLIGGMLGYMLGSSGGRSGGSSAAPVTHNTTVVNKTIVNKTYTAPRPSYSSPRISRR